MPEEARTEECSLSGDLAVLVCEQLLVPFVTGEADCHLGDDAGKHCAETFVETQRGFTLDNFGASLEETALRCL
jgi:hypothetical protein